MNKKGVANIIFVIIIVILVGIVGYLVFMRNLKAPFGTPTPTPPPITPTPTLTTELNEPVSIQIFIYEKSFDLENRTFEGKIWSEEKHIKILTTDSTKFYRMASGPTGEHKEYFTFSEFYSLIKDWEGPPWPFTVKGVLKKENVIQADEVFMIAQ